MKKKYALILIILFSGATFSQEQLGSLLVQPGTIVNSKPKTTASNNIANNQQNWQPLTTTTSNNVVTNTTTNATALPPLNSGNTIIVKPNTIVSNNNTPNNLPPLNNCTTTKVVSNTYGNTQQVLPPLTSSNNNNNNSQSSTYNLPPLPTKPAVTQQQPLPTYTKYETIDPNLINKNSTGSATANYSTSANHNQYKMPELSPINTATNNSQYNVNSGNAMPELAPITANTSATNTTGTMPELSPIDGNQSNVNYNQNQQQNTNSNSNGLKGFILPKGVILDSKKATYIIQPISQNQMQAAPVKEDVGTIEYTRGIGGSIGLIADLPKGFKAEEPQQQYVPSPQPYTTQQQNYQQRIPQQPQLATQQNQAVPCQHIHASYCPCCVKAPKKWYPKKKWTPKKVYKPTVTYVYQEPAPKPQIQYRDRIVYVPQQSAPQPQPVVQQPQQKIIYTDYTKVYYKEPEKPSCNCPVNGQPNNQKSSYDPSKYYYPANYQNLNAGPTSGDYPVAGYSSNAPMQYSFYLNNKGKYSVGVYNQYFNVLLSQNGKVIGYNVNGDPNLDPNSYKPKLNYFGSPESIAGVPIEYNYNRSVHKIGNIVMEYDFEGFFKRINGSNVFYNSRSSLQRVDNIGVHYDAGGYVSSVDYNNGIVQYNPQQQ